MQLFSLTKTFIICLKEVLTLARSVLYFSSISGFPHRQIPPAPGVSTEIKFLSARTFVSAEIPWKVFFLKSLFLTWLGYESTQNSRNIYRNYYKYSPYSHTSFSYKWHILEKLWLEANSFSSEATVNIQVWYTVHSISQHSKHIFEFSSLCQVSQTTGMWLRLWLQCFEKPTHRPGHSRPRLDPWIMPLTPAPDVTSHQCLLSPAPFTLNKVEMEERVTSRWLTRRPSIYTWSSVNPLCGLKVSIIPQREGCQTGACTLGRQ